MEAVQAAGSPRWGRADRYSTKLGVFNLWRTKLVHALWPPPGGCNTIVQFGTGTPYSYKQTSPSVTKCLLIPAMVFWDQITSAWIMNIREQFAIPVCFALNPAFNMYESMWVQERGLYLDIAVLHIRTIKTCRIQKYSRMLALIIFLKRNWLAQYIFTMCFITICVEDAYWSHTKY